MKRLVYQVSWLSLSLFAAACDGGGGGSVPPDQLGVEMGSAMCAHFAECCTVEEFMDQTLGAENEEECRALYAGFVGGLLVPVLEDSIAAGRVVYHGDRMAGCLDLMRSLSCSDFNELEAADSPWLVGCQDPFEGQVAIGGECANDWDCVSEYCSGESTDFDGNVTFGACANAPSIGQPCDDFECADNAYCESGPTPTCQALLSDGSACSSGDDCASGGCEGSVCGPPTTCDGVD